MKMEKRVEELKQMLTAEPFLSDGPDRISGAKPLFGGDMEIKFIDEEEVPRRDRQFVGTRR